MKRARQRNPTGDSMVAATRQLDEKVTTRRHSYDGLNRRVRKALGDPSSPTSTTDYIHNTNWQIIEVYEGSTLVEQNVWGLDYIDTPVLMRLYDAATSSLVDRRALFDANRHVTSLHDATNGRTKATGRPLPKVSPTA